MLPRQAEGEGGCATSKDALINAPSHRFRLRNMSGQALIERFGKGTREEKQPERWHEARAWPVLLGMGEVADFTINTP